MTLLELLNLSASILLFPNDDGQPPTFPTPSIGDYLTDLAHYLRTHMSYVDDLYQSGIRKYLIAETVFIYFFLIAGLRRFRLAQLYLLVKLVTFALLFLTSGLSYWNFLAWILCFLVYPLEVLVLFMFAAWFFHRHSLKKINRKTGLYRVDKIHLVKHRRKDGTFYWEEQREYYATRGLFTPDRLFYHWSFIGFYACAKFKMILGNPLAYFYKLYGDYCADNAFLISGPEYDLEFNDIRLDWTTWRGDRVYRRTVKKHPLLGEFHRQAIAGDAALDRYIETTTLESIHRKCVDIVQLPTATLFGFKFPWVVDEERFQRKNAERWLGNGALPYEWTTTDIYWRTTPKSNFGVSNIINKALEKYNEQRKEQAWKRVRNNLYHPPKPEPTILSSRTLGQRIIDNLSTEQFNSTRAAILSPVDNKHYTALTAVGKRRTIGVLSTPKYRYKANSWFSGMLPGGIFRRDKKLWLWNDPVRRYQGPGFVEMRPNKTRRRNFFFRSFPDQRHVRWPGRKPWAPRDPVTPWIKGKTYGLVEHHTIYTERYTTWRKGYKAPEVRTGFTGFNFEQFAPLMELDSISNLRYGLLFILALSSLTVYSIILAGWSSNSKYAFLGALRSAAQMISYEVSISLALLPVILLSGSLNLTAIVYGQIETVWYLFPLLPIALVFLVSMLAETNRTPFDLPEAEAELVAGYNVDYSSLPFAMFFLGEYSNMILISVLFCLLFLGGWDGAIVVLQEPYVLTIKAAFVWVFFVIVRATLPRYRYDQLMDIGWKAFLPFAGSFLVFVIGLVIFLDVAPVVEEVALEDLYGAPAPFPTETPATTAPNLQPLTSVSIIAFIQPWGATKTLPPTPATPLELISTAPRP